MRISVIESTAFGNRAIGFRKHTVHNYRTGPRLPHTRLIASSRHHHRHHLSAARWHRRTRMLRTSRCAAVRQRACVVIPHPIRCREPLPSTIQTRRDRTPVSTKPISTRSACPKARSPDFTHVISTALTTASVCLAAFAASRTCRTIRQLIAVLRWQPMGLTNRPSRSRIACSMTLCTLRPTRSHCRPKARPTSISAPTHAARTQIASRMTLSTRGR